MRDLYEVAADAILRTAHSELEKLVGTIHQNHFKPALDDHWAFLVYAGLWYEPLLQDLNAFMDSVNAQVTGRSRCSLYKGSGRRGAAPVAQRAVRRRAGGVRRVGRAVPQHASPGFIELWTLQSRMAFGIRNRR